MKTSILSLLVGYLVAIGSAAPTPSGEQTSSVYNIQGDPQYTVSQELLQASIDCPNGFDKLNTVLLIPGTGEKTEPYYRHNIVPLLQSNGLPNICYLNTPAYSLGDVQITSEYVAFAINYLYSRSNSPLRLVSHSQGGLNVQWALTFFPSTRNHVYSFVALSPDYRGTVLGPLITAPQEVVGGKAQASVFQQTAGSNLLKALAKKEGGLSVWSRTWNVNTKTDGIVQPQGDGDGGSGNLNGATNLFVQDVCPGKLVSHFGIAADVVTQFVVLQAFLKGDRPENSVEQFKVGRSDRIKLCTQLLPLFDGVKAVVEFNEANLSSSLRLGFDGSGFLDKEPEVMEYAK